MSEQVSQQIPAQSLPWYGSTWKNLKRGTVDRQVCLIVIIFWIPASFSDRQDSYFDQTLSFTPNRKTSQAQIWSLTMFKSLVLLLLKLVFSILWIWRQTKTTMLRIIVQFKRVLVHWRLLHQFPLRTKSPPEIIRSETVGPDIKFNIGKLRNSVLHDVLVETRVVNTEKDENAVDSLSCDWERWFCNNGHLRTVEPRIHSRTFEKTIWSGGGGWSQAIYRSSTRCRWKLQSWAAALYHGFLSEYMFFCKILFPSQTTSPWVDCARWTFEELLTLENIQVEVRSQNGFEVEIYEADSGGRESYCIYINNIISYQSRSQNYIKYPATGCSCVYKNAQE